MDFIVSSHEKTHGRNLTLLTFKKKSLFIYEQLRTLHVARGFSTVPSTLFSFGCREKVSEKLTKKKMKSKGHELIRARVQVNW